MPKNLIADQVADTETGATRIEHIRRGGVVYTRVTLRVRLDDGTSKLEEDEWPRSDELGGLSVAQHNAFLVANRNKLLALKGYTGS